MSAPISLLLDPTTVHVVSRDGSLSRDIAWSPEAPDAMVASVRSLAGSPSAIVIVVGLGFLEIAEPDLPPMSPDARRTVLWRDADRYFPLDQPIAVVNVESFALALPAQRLAGWVQAISALGSVRAIVTAPQVCASVVGTGSCTLDAGLNEHGLIEARDGRLLSIRRTASDSSVRAPAADTSALGRRAQQWIDAPVALQLMDTTLLRAFRRTAKRRLLMSAVVATAAVLLLAWSADRRRNTTLTALETQAAMLTEQASPAIRAEARRAKAQREVQLLAAADAALQSPDAPLAVLAQLTRLLPRDAFVQRLEWDGQVWRVDGTADNARRLVPLLDSDARFRDVRIASASQRFLDGGRQRESFAISFRTRAAAGATHGAP